MSIALPKGYHWDHDLRQGRETAELTSRLWPNYLTRESDIHEPGLRFEITAQEFARRFPVWGIRADESNQLVAYANAVQLTTDLNATSLPDSGWRFAIQSAGSKTPPNCLCLLVANVAACARGLGLSRLLIERAKLAARELGFSLMIAPVRPTRKEQSPTLPMAEYLQLQSQPGASGDPWVNLHLKAGASLMNVCSTSVRIVASLPKWREWTGLPLQVSGEEILPGGLAPLAVDTEKNIGIYHEPNVWMRYPLN